MVQEQSPKYLRAFGSHHVKSPGSKLGRPPSQGNPGYNPDLMVMDLVKLRLDASYKALIHELKVNKKNFNVMETNISNHGLGLDFLVAEEVHVPLGRRHPGPW